MLLTVGKCFRERRRHLFAYQALSPNTTIERTFRLQSVCATDPRWLDRMRITCSNPHAWEAPRSRDRQWRLVRKGAAQPRVPHIPRAR